MLFFLFTRDPLTVVLRRLSLAFDSSGFRDRRRSCASRHIAHIACTSQLPGIWAGMCSLANTTGVSMVFSTVIQF